MKNYYRILNTTSMQATEYINNYKCIVSIFAGKETDILGVTLIELETEIGHILADRDSVQAVSLIVTDEDITKLYNELRALLIKRKNRELLKALDLQEFTDYVAELKQLYIKEAETAPIYNYIADSLYSLVCYGV